MNKERKGKIFGCNDKYWNVYDKYKIIQIIMNFLDWKPGLGLEQRGNKTSRIRTECRHKKNT